MPPLCLCAASAPLHETPLSEIELCLEHARIQHHAHHHHHHHHRHHHQRACTKETVEIVRSDAIRVGDFTSQVQTMYESLCRTKISSGLGYTAVPALRSDLAVIPRVGFPPKESMVLSSGVANNICALRRPSASKTESENQDVLEKFSYLLSSTDGKSLICCRIEAMFI